MRYGDCKPLAPVARPAAPPASDGDEAAVRFQHFCCGATAVCCPSARSDTQPNSASTQPSAFRCIAGARGEPRDALPGLLRQRALLCVLPPAPVPVRQVPHCSAAHQTHDGRILLHLLWQAGDGGCLTVISPDHAGYVSRTHAAIKSRGTWEVAAATMQRARASRPRSIVPPTPGACCHLLPSTAGTPVITPPCACCTLRCWCSNVEQPRAR